jgi:serine/threonine-protein kinase mTOR
MTFLFLPDANVRQIVLANLSDRFDKYLAQVENVRSIFIALNDEVFENRVTVIGLIGRLAKRNPAYTMPSIRKILIQLLTELEYSTVMYVPLRHCYYYNSGTYYVCIRRNREECTRLLTLLVRATQHLIKPYALPMLRVLLLKANDGNAAVAANVLMCLGELTCVGGEDTMPHIPELMQVIIARLSDPSLDKRDAALHALGQICGSTGYVITPLVEYPQLLPALGRIMRTEPTKNARREVMKVLGILGALDPFRRMVRFEYSELFNFAETSASRSNPRWTLRTRCPLRPSIFYPQGKAVRRQHLTTTI